MLNYLIRNISCIVTAFFELCGHEMKDYEFREFSGLITQNVKVQRRNCNEYIKRSTLIEHWNCRKLLKTILKGQLDCLLLNLCLRRISLIYRRMDMNHTDINQCSILVPRHIPLFAFNSSTSNNYRMTCEIFPLPNPFNSPTTPLSTTTKFTPRTICIISIVNIIRAEGTTSNATCNFFDSRRQMLSFSFTNTQTISTAIRNF